MTHYLDDVIARPQQTVRFVGQMLCTVSDVLMHGIAHDKRGDT
jgi:hypothetical protein